MEQNESLNKDKLLEMADISKAYSGVQALYNVNFDLEAGEVHALVGENGAGKSTLVKILTGIENKDGGQIKINGATAHIRNPHHARGLGIAAIFQELSQIPTLTVAENVYLEQESTRFNFLLDRKQMIARTQGILDKYGIDLDPADRLCDLSAAQQQLVEIVKAISRKPKILIMDEPTSALTEAEAEIVFRIIEDFKNQKAGIIYVSHRMDEIFRITDRVTVLRDGRLISQNNIKELNLVKIVNLMVGREVELYESRLKTAHLKEEGIPALEIKNLTRKNAFTNVSFKLYAGEILGIAGLVGSGRSELVKAIFGVEKSRFIGTGQILINGKPVKISSVKDALKLGIALLPESRHKEGLALKHTIRQNMLLPILKRFSYGSSGLLNYKKADKIVGQKIRELDIRPGLPEKIVNFLSGGNQQKVVISKWLLTEPKILIVDEPTAGIDVHTKSEIHKLIRKLVENPDPIGVIMISSEMPELLAHSDRVMIMNKGRVLGILRDTNQEEIMSLIMNDIIKSKKE